MCQHGDTVLVLVPIPAALAHDGRARWSRKPVDRCLAPLVQALNTAGRLTAASCCGHGNGPGSVILQDGRTLTVKTRPANSATKPEARGVDTNARV